MPDARIPEDLILRVSRSIGEIEDVREQASEDLKVTWADMREELKGLGLTGKEVSAEVGFLKAAISETRKSAEDHAKAETKAEGVEGYLEILNSPRARARARKKPQSAPQAAQSQGFIEVAPRSSPDRREGDDDGQPIQPETANDIGEAQKVERRSPKPEDAGSIPAAYASAGSSSGRTADFGSANEGSNPSPASKIIEGMTEALAVARGEDEPHAVYTFTPKPHDGPFSSNGLPRPKGCQHVDACGGTWRGLCASCERALADQSEPETTA